jgi:hypothetical protein
MRSFDLRDCTLALLFVFVSTSSAFANSLTLEWDPPTDGITTGYILHCGTAPGVYTTQINVGPVTTRKVEGLGNGTKYYFAVQAYSAGGALSGLSNVISGTTSGTPSAGSICGPSDGGSSGGGGSTGGGGSSGGGGSTGGGSAGGGSTGGGASSGSAGAYAAGAAEGPQTSIVATLRDARYIDIAWLALDGVSGYRVEVGSGAGQTAYSAVTPHTAITFDTASFASAAYHVRVRGIFAGLPGTASNEEIVAGSGFAKMDVTTDAAGAQCGDVPGAPRQFIAGANGSAASLSWQPGTGELASSFVLQVGSAPGLQNLMTVPLPGSQYGLQAQAANGLYALRLVAINSCGSSVWGAESLLSVGGVSAAANAALPGAPEMVSGDVIGTLVSLSWTPPTAGGPVTRYLVEAMTAQGPVALDTGNPATAFAHPDTPAGEYVITIRAGNGAGFGPPSNPVTVIVQ